MSQPFKINLYNRYTQKNETESVYGHKAIEFAYNSFMGKLIAPVIASKILSKLYGSLQDHSSSRKKIPAFIKDFSINISDYDKGSLIDQKKEESYKNFNEFFIRKFKAGKRVFTPDLNKMGACAEARYFGHAQITDELTIPVKGSMLKAKDLLTSIEHNKSFDGGPLLIARLCPVDYHRYHYPDNGKTVNSYQVNGELHSVNPLALKFRNDIFIKNERRVSILETENFGRLCYIEVGATCVGRIVQSFDETKKFQKGDEKGYFLFGGSTVIICGEKGRWKPSSDILKNTELGIETYIHLGDEVAEHG
ncbi:MAG: phosphatidylserine decarboxylase [Halobacteriovoraceae bacterium]|jgi:phosphatidylserine decarboxylase|nr:phosphatidylserine decarboxylase [Halobacteriovoraceae bacterium]